MSDRVDLGDRLASLLGELVRIPSVNPEHAGEKAGEPGEAVFAGWIAERARQLGAEVVVDEVTDGRPNVYATFPGTGETTLAIDTHLDTVGVEHMTRDPFDGVIEGTRLYGRGSVDTKATLAVVFAVVEDMLAEGAPLGPSVQVVGTVGEEILGMIGAARYKEWLAETGTKIDQLITAEPTNCRPVHGHKGGFDLLVDVQGKAVHASLVDLGVNAISAASRIVAMVDAEHADLQSAGGATAVGPGSVAVTQINGFTAPNIIPGHCQVRVHRRVAPGEDLENVAALLSERIVESALPGRAEVSIAGDMALPSFFRNPDSALVNALARHASTDPDVASFGTNAMVYGDLDVDMAIFGPGSIDQAHQAEEWIEIDELVKAYDVYRKIFSR